MAIEQPTGRVKPARIEWAKMSPIMRILEHIAAPFFKCQLPDWKVAQMKNDLITTEPTGRLDSIPGTRSRELVATFLAGRKPTTLKTYSQSLDDFAQFVKAARSEDAARILLGRAHGDANHLALLYRLAVTIVFRDSPVCCSSLSSVNMNRPSPPMFSIDPIKSSASSPSPSSFSTVAFSFINCCITIDSTALDPQDSRPWCPMLQDAHQGSGA